MNIFKKENRNQYIESLEFFYFLKKLKFSFSLRDRYRKSTNPLILNFFKMLEEFYSRESDKIAPYRQALTDQVFWGSSKFYYETMRKFVGGELTALKFAQEFSDRFLADQEEADNLVKDFKKQVNLELTPNIFEFSDIILDFGLLLELYQDELEEPSENDLSFSDDSILEGVKRALEKIDKYFTD